MELVVSRETNRTNTPCSWCYSEESAPWVVNDGFGPEYVCTVHGTEWFPGAFPESDTAPIECIVRDMCSPVGHVVDTPRPWYPLVGHRDGLRANDLVSLASAFWILALEGGTAHGPWHK